MFPPPWIGRSVVAPSTCFVSPERDQAHAPHVSPRNVANPIVNPFRVSDGNEAEVWQVRGSKRPTVPPPQEPRPRTDERERELEREPTNWSEIAVLVRQAQAGDRAAFGRLVEQFQRTVHAICLRRLGNPSEAVEMTQEVFLHVMGRIDQLREPERFAGWLRQVAVRMAINRATRRLAPPGVDTVGLEGPRDQPR